MTAISNEGIQIANNDIKNRLTEILYSLKFNLPDDLKNKLSVIEDLLNKPVSNEVFTEICYELCNLLKNLDSGYFKKRYMNNLKKSS